VRWQFLVLRWTLLIQHSPDQLVLLDDPAFMPYMTLPELDFDFSKMDLDSYNLRDSQGSILSPHTQSRRDSAASEGGSILGLVIPTSELGGSGYQLPLNDPFQLGDPSIHKTSALGRLYENEDEALIEDFDFEFDADGKLRDIDVAERELLRSESVPPRLSSLGSDSAASGRVHFDQEGGLGGLATGLLHDDGDFLIQLDEEFVLPDAEPFPAFAAARHGQLESDALAANPTESSLVSAEAPLKTRKRKAPKLFTKDKRAELPSADLKSWNENYLQNMDAAIHIKQVHRAPALAKKNAYVWVFGNGLAGIGDGIGASRQPSPLEIFSGDNLMTAISGVPAPKLLVHPSKRSHDADDGGIETRRVRARQELEDQVGRREDDGFMPVFEESICVEAGRDAQSALEDHTASAMPWNISASLHSFRNLPGPGSSSAHGHGAFGGRQSSVLSAKLARLTSASPLIGRGRSDILALEWLDDVEFTANGSGNFVDALDRQNLPLTDTQAEEFEIFGATAAVDTQTAQDSYWVKEALARESLNFLEYVKNSLLELEADELEDDILMGGVQSARVREVTFETLFPPDSNSMMVAAQAFYHVLTLATKNLLHVRQAEPYTDIWMGSKDLI
jgi:meiotic recombination protein REC8, fungi type